jgi:hypothetical protein
MRLIRRERVFVAKLLDNLFNLVKVAVCKRISDGVFKPDHHQFGLLGSTTYSKAPAFLLSYSLSVNALWVFASMVYDQMDVCASLSS